MARITHITTAALVAAALAPAAALAENELRGAPTLQRVTADAVQVRFVTDERLERRASDNRYDASVVLRGLGERSGVSAAGRHGDDHIYRAVFRGREAAALEEGERYRVTIRVGDDTPITRTLRLKPARR